MGGIGLNPSTCCCGECTQDTSLCISVSKTCGNLEVAGVEVEATGPGGTYSGTTDAVNGRVCFDDVVPGHYDITTSKDGCTTPSGSVDVACGDDKSVNIGKVNCSPGQVFTFDIDGCAENPLPGCVCTLSGANSGSAVTDASGHCEIPITASGVTLWSVSHPSGRFQDASGSKTVSLCSSNGVGLALSPADGFACCFPFLGASEELQDNPYPISTSLLWTDCTGEYEFEIDPTGCGQDVCTQVELGDVSLTGPSSCATCTGGGTKQFPPTDIGVHPIHVLLTINFSTLGYNILRYLYRTYTGVSSTKFFNYKTGAACPDCGTDDASRSWRIDDTCEDLADTDPVGNPNYEIRASSAYTVNSAVPFNLTATINPTGNGYGPGDPFTTWNGSAPCATVVISEIL